MTWSWPASSSGSVHPGYSRWNRDSAQTLPLRDARDSANSAKRRLTDRPLAPAFPEGRGFRFCGSTGYRRDQMAHVTIWQVVSGRSVAFTHGHKPWRSGLSILPAPLPGHLLRSVDGAFHAGGNDYPQGAFGPLSFFRFDCRLNDLGGDWRTGSMAPATRHERAALGRPRRCFGLFRVPG
jgi:hypothetical protein